MELLPPTPKIQRKFPMTEPLGEPSGPIDLFGRGRDSAQALSIATRRAAGLDRRISAMTFAGMGQLPSDLDMPLDQMAYPMMRAEALGQIPQLLRAERLPLMLNPNLGLRVGLPGELNRPPSQLAVPQIRREANLNVSPAEYTRQFRMAMDHRANNNRLAGLGAGVAQAPGMPSSITQAEAVATVSRILEIVAASQAKADGISLNGLGAMVAEKIQIPETAGAYDAQAFSSNYVDRIKAGVRIDYGEQQYAGYANAARAAQYQSSAFVGATYNYPEAFMRRGISLAGSLGALGDLDPTTKGLLKSFGVPADIVDRVQKAVQNPKTLEAVGEWGGNILTQYVLTGKIDSLGPCDRYNIIVGLLGVVGVAPTANLQSVFGCKPAGSGAGSGSGTGAGASGGGLNTNRGGGTADKKIPTWVWVVSGVGGVAVLGLITYLAVRK